MADHNDYQGSLKEGKKCEEAVTVVAEFCGFKVERNDSEDVNQPDLKITAYVDVKNRKTLFKTAKKNVGLQPKEAIPININKIQKYPDNTILLFVVENYGESNGLYVVRLKKAKNLSARNPDRHHKYKHRKDVKGHAREPFYIRPAECSRLPDWMYEKILEELNGKESDGT